MWYHWVLFSAVLAACCLCLALPFQRAACFAATLLARDNGRFARTATARRICIRRRVAFLRRRRRASSLKIDVISFWTTILASYSQVPRLLADVLGELRSHSSSRRLRGVLLRAGKSNPACRENEQPYWAANPLHGSQNSAPRVSKIPCVWESESCLRPGLLARRLYVVFHWLPPLLVFPIRPHEPMCRVLFHILRFSGYE